MVSASPVVAAAETVQIEGGMEGRSRLSRSAMLLPQSGFTVESLRTKATEALGLRVQIVDLETGRADLRIHNAEVSRERFTDRGQVNHNNGYTDTSIRDGHHFTRC